MSEAYMPAAGLGIYGWLVLGAGVRMCYWFSDEMSGEDSVAGWRDRACGPFERHDSAMHFLRRWHVRCALLP